MRPLVLLRPEPGLSQSMARAQAAGLTAIACPLFAIQSVSWKAPEPSNYDALLLTSANAIRHGGKELATLSALPVHAVGDATAEAARQAGFTVASVGSGGVDALLATLAPGLRLISPGGEDRHVPPREVDMVTVYRAAAVADPELPTERDCVFAVHSPRAGARLAELAVERADATIAAISGAAAATCGPDWREIAVAERPDDESLLALAARLCQTSPRS